MDVQMYRYDGSSWVKINPTPAAHSHAWGDISGKPSWIGSSKPTYSWSEIISKPSWIGSSKPTYSWSEIYDKPNGWKLLSSTSYNITSTSYVVTSITSLSAGDVLALEVCYGNSSSSHSRQIITVAIGTDGSTSGTKTYPRTVGITEFDGVYLKVINFKAYSVSGTLRLGYLSALVGEFHGSAIHWTTNDSITLYVKRIWKLV